jgi:hypothetical protein
MRYFGMRRQRVVRSQEEIQAEKAKKEALAMTCQICGRRIFAEAGVIAHHGYERPFEGIQTVSCSGARRMPYEVSKVELKIEVGWLKERVEAFQVMIAERKVAKFLTWEFEGKEFVEGYSRKRVHKKISLEVTEETFKAVQQQHRALTHFPEYIYSFKELKEQQVRKLSCQLRAYEQAFEVQSKRLAAWKQTHRKGGKGEATWVAV